MIEIKTGTIDKKTALVEKRVVGKSDMFKLLLWHQSKWSGTKEQQRHNHFSLIRVQPIKTNGLLHYPEFGRRTVF